MMAMDCRYCYADKLIIAMSITEALIVEMSIIETMIIERADKCNADNIDRE